MNTEYQPGDKITCEFIVLSISSNPDNIRVEGRGVWIPKESIIKHEPKPWTPEVGEMILMKDGGGYYGVKGVMGEYVWAQRLGGSVPYTFKISAFDRITR